MSDEPSTPSPDEVTAACTEKGGWTKDQLAAWGVPWPPPKGWRTELEERWRDEQGSTRGLPIGGFR